MIFFLLFAVAFAGACGVNEFFDFEWIIKQVFRVVSSRPPVDNVAFTSGRFETNAATGAVRFDWSGVEFLMAVSCNRVSQVVGLCFVSR